MNKFLAKKYCIFNGSSYHPGDPNNDGDSVMIEDNGVLIELSKGRHPKKKTTPISPLFNHFVPEELSDVVEPYVTAFLKGGDFKAMLTAEAKTLDIDTKDMSIHALRVAVMMKKNKEEDGPEDLSKLTVKLLKDRAADMEIEDFDKMLKPALIEAIEQKLIENAG